MGEINPVPEIGPESQGMKFFSFSHAFRPETKFLGQATVAGPVSFSEWKVQFIGDIFQVSHHDTDFFGGDVEKVCQKLSLFGCFRMEGKGTPADGNLVLFL
jgi:hypothetical protein